MLPRESLDDDEELRAGAYLHKSLRLLRPLADGGMGRVWTAEHLALGIQVAVKFLRGSLLGHAVARSRFRREAAAAARVRNPHVVQILDYDVTPRGRPYIVMELLDGETLGARLNRLGRMDVDTTLTVIAQVCRALAKAHDLGIVHRDIKPENLFLLEGAEETFVKILDFGVAKEIHDSGIITSDGIIGTPQFMAPEQMAGLEVGPPADVWAVGVVAYCCLTGKLPFDGNTFVGMAVALEKGIAMTLPSKLDLPVPPSVEAWLERALTPDPSQRFATARGMLEALEAHPQTAKEPGPALDDALPPNGMTATIAGTLGPTLRIDRRRALARRRQLLHAGAAALVGVSLSVFVSIGWRAADLHPAGVEGAPETLAPTFVLTPRAADSSAPARPDVGPRPAAAAAAHAPTAPSSAPPTSARWPMNQRAPSPSVTRPDAESSRGSAADAPWPGADPIVRELRDDTGDSMTPDDSRSLDDSMTPDDSRSLDDSMTPDDSSMTPDESVAPPSDQRDAHWF